MLGYEEQHEEDMANKFFWEIWTEQTIEVQKRLFEQKM